MLVDRLIGCCLTKRQRIPKEHIKMDNPEKLATYIGYTRRRKTKRTHNTICIEYHYTQTNTNNINKT